MQLVMHVAGFATVVTQIAAFPIAGEVHGQQAPADLQFAAAQFEDERPVLHRLGCEALQCFRIP